MLETYEEVLQYSLDKFQDCTVSHVLESLGDKRRFLGSEQPFPRQLVESTVGSDRPVGEKVTEVMVIIGTWINATSGTRWAAGPVDVDPYSVRVGIGLAGSDGASFIPLLAHAEQIIEEWGQGSEQLDIIQSAAELSKKLILNGQEGIF